MLNHIKLDFTFATHYIAHNDRNIFYTQQTFMIIFAIRSRFVTVRRSNHFHFLSSIGTTQGAILFRGRRFFFLPITLFFEWYAGSVMDQMLARELPDGV